MVAETLFERVAPLTHLDLFPDGLFVHIESEHRIPVSHHDRDASKLRAMLGRKLAESSRFVVSVIERHHVGIKDVNDERTLLLTDELTRSVLPVTISPSMPDFPSRSIAARAARVTGDP